MKRLSEGVLIYALAVPVILFYGQLSLEPTRRTATNTEPVLVFAGCVSESPGLPGLYLVSISNTNATTGPTADLTVHVGYFGRYRVNSPPKISNSDTTEHRHVCLLLQHHGDVLSVKRSKWGHNRRLVNPHQRPECNTFFRLCRNHPEQDILLPHRFRWTILRRFPGVFRYMYSRA